MKEPPKVIISYITMPVMDGFELCRAIRQDDALKNIPVILLILLTDAREVIKDLNACATFYFALPIRGGST